MGCECSPERVSLAAFVSKTKCGWYCYTRSARAAQNVRAVRHLGELGAPGVHATEGAGLCSVFPQKPGALRKHGTTGKVVYAEVQPFQDGHEELKGGRSSVVQKQGRRRHGMHPQGRNMVPADPPPSRVFLGAIGVRSPPYSVSPSSRNAGLKDPAFGRASRRGCWL
jgi:hypothetical protein